MSLDDFFFEQAVVCNVRTDGRSRTAFRPFSMETGVLVGCLSSCHIRRGPCHVLAGVKADLATPVGQMLNEGSITVYVDCSPIEALENKSRDLEEQLASHLQHILVKSGVLDLRSLCVTAGSEGLAWHLHVDCLCFSLDGSLVDALSLAIRGALIQCRLPRVRLRRSALRRRVEWELVDRDDADADDDELDGGGGGGDGKKNSSKKRSDTVGLAFAGDVGICVTLARIGGVWAVDPTEEEEQHAECLMIVASGVSGKLHYVWSGRRDDDDERFGDGDNQQDDEGDEDEGEVLSGNAMVVAKAKKRDPKGISARPQGLPVAASLEMMTMGSQACQQMCLAQNDALERESREQKPKAFLDLR